MVTEIEGNLIQLALEGKFDAIAHGCNCFCRQKSGIAADMVKTFGTDSYHMEGSGLIGDKGKLGTIEADTYILSADKSPQKSFLEVINFYTQYYWATSENPKPFNYGAFWSCLQWYRRMFSQYHLGIPMIGAGLAGGDWTRIREIIEEFNDLNITIVKYKK